LHFYLKSWISLLFISSSALFLAQGETCATAIETQLLINNVENLNTGGSSSNECYSDSSNSIWFYHEAVEGEEMVIRTTCDYLNPNPNTRLSVYIGECGSLACIATSDSAGPGGSPGSELYFTAQADRTYYFEWNNYLSSDDFQFLFEGFGASFDCPDLCSYFWDGYPCDDGDPNTINDAIDGSQCLCIGVLPECPELLLNVGDPCDDGDPNTINDVIDGSQCLCIGVLPECPGLLLNVGDPCDDGNPLTVSDQVNNTCSCEGVIGCQTDLNGTGTTTGDDFSIFIGHLGGECDPEISCPTDFNNSGITDGHDFIIFLGNYGSECTPPAIISLNKNNYPQYKIFQRNSSDQYDFALSGSYTGVCAVVEASFDGNPYTTIDAAPSGGTFSGTLVDQGVGQGRLSVRCTNDPLAEDGADDIGVGDVYVIAGQSNAEGNGLIAQQYTTVAPTASVFPTVYSQSDTWGVGNDDTDPGGGEGSAWPILGGYIAENTGVPVNFITTASGGTNLHTQWQPGNPIYNSFVNQIAEANVNGVKAVLWFQGESDVDDNTSRSEYNALLDQLIIDFQSDAPGTPDLVPGILGSRLGNLNQIKTTAIRLATQDAWDDNESILHGPQTYDIHIINDGEGDNIHFGTDEELQTLAFRWWKAVEEHYYSGTEGRGPQVISAQMGFGNTSIDIDFNASSDLQGGTSIGMWFVDDNGTERTVTNAVLVDTNTVRLTLDQATTSLNITLTYAKGNSGENQDVLTDSTTGNTAAGTSPLPADGFSDYLVVPAPTQLNEDIGVR
jgi:hypothetical protein